MEMTQEQREKYNREYQREYQKEYRKNNAEKIIEYNREYRKNNPEKFRGYREKAKDYLTNYYKEHREHIREQQKEYRENNVYLDAIYFFIDKNNETLYLGSSARLNERISSHMTANSNLKMTAEELAEIGLKKIIYKDFSEYGLSRADLFFIEQYFKNKVKELIECRKSVGYKEEELTHSKEELIRIAEETDYKEYKKLERYLN